jgi:anti-sigma B factor antagonist
MKIRVNRNNPAFSKIELSGDLDFHTSPQVRQEFLKLAEDGAKKILIDLEKVGYIDSSGLATFVELFQKLRRSGGQLVLFNLMPAVQSVFEIAKLDTVFHLAKTEEEALSFVS